MRHVKQWVIGVECRAEFMISGELMAMMVTKHDMNLIRLSPPQQRQNNTQPDAVHRALASHSQGHNACGYWTPTRSFRWLSYSIGRQRAPAAVNAQRTTHNFRVLTCWTFVHQINLIHQFCHRLTVIIYKIHFRIAFASTLIALCILLQSSVFDNTNEYTNKNRPRPIGLGCQQKRSAS